jgi:UDP-glucose 4-epimerase
MKNTLPVTGGLGRIGSHTIVKLLFKCLEIVIADNIGNPDIMVHD